MSAVARTITTPRLDLIPISPSCLRASLDGNRERAEAHLGLSVPLEWYDARPMMVLRLEQMETDPALEPWLLRAIGLREERSMVGYLGFHSAVGPAYLRRIAPGGIELGYAVFQSFRRRGYAFEAVAALLDWAQADRRIKRFILSINPCNEPSLKLAAKLGFRRLDWHLEKPDGPEDVYERQSTGIG